MSLPYLKERAESSLSVIVLIKPGYHFNYKKKIESLPNAECNMLLE